MTRRIFDLTNNLTATPPAVDPGPRLHVPLRGLVPAVAPGDRVSANQALAHHPARDMGDVLAPMAGEAVRVTREAVVLELDGPGSPAEPGPVRDLLDLSAVETVSRLKALGLDTRAMFQARVLVVNAVNPEPGVLTHAHYLAEQSTAVARGLELAMKTVMPSEVILAKLAGSPGGLPQAREVEVQPRHPAGMAPLVVKAATGLENPADVCLLSTPYLHDLGRAAETGLPVPRTLITVGSLNYSALIGTPVRRVLEAADIEPAAGDRVILGGVFTGQAAYTLEAGVDRDTLGLSVVADGAYPPVEDNPCLHCGECVRRCPSRIRPGLLSRFAEFDLLDRAREWGIEACMECGLCGYHCPGRRPVLQYIRKGKLALAARECSGEADNSQST